MLEGKPYSYNIVSNQYCDTTLSRVPAPQSNPLTAKRNAQHERGAQKQQLDSVYQELKAKERESTLGSLARKELETKVEALQIKIEQLQEEQLCQVLGIWLYFIVI